VVFLPYEQKQNILREIQNYYPYPIFFETNYLFSFSKIIITLAIRIYNNESSLFIHSAARLGPKTLSITYLFTMLTEK